MVHRIYSGNISIIKLRFHSPIIIKNVSRSFSLTKGFFFFFFSTYYSSTAQLLSRLSRREFPRRRRNRIRIEIARFLPLPSSRCFSRTIMRHIRMRAMEAVSVIILEAVISVYGARRRGPLRALCVFFSFSPRPGRLLLRNSTRTCVTEQPSYRRTKGEGKRVRERLPASAAFVGFPSVSLVKATRQFNSRLIITNARASSPFRGEEVRHRNRDLRDGERERNRWSTVDFLGDDAVACG